jgi:Fic family protein
MYIYQNPEWANFKWDNALVLQALADFKLKHGKLMGKLEALGFSLQNEAIAEAFTAEVVFSSEIEGEPLNTEEVRSSVARRLGLPFDANVKVSRSVESAVELLSDATQDFQSPLTKERLFAWHASLFPTGYSGLYKIKVAQYRNDENGPMQVVSGAIGKEKVHFQAPDASRLPEEMEAFLSWFNQSATYDSVLKAAIAHLWFVTLHPFDDGNGRLARTMTELLLARGETSSQRFYSMSSQLRQEHATYYKHLEQTQKGGLDVTAWLLWFVEILGKAVEASEQKLDAVLKKVRFWQQHQQDTFNARQLKLLQRLLDGFEGKLTSSKWSKLCHTSQDTAHRDLYDLVERGILEKVGEGRGTHYLLCGD